jgi:hypothetical protein
MKKATGEKAIGTSSGKACKKAPETREDEGRRRQT